MQLPRVPTDLLMFAAPMFWIDVCSTVVLDWLTLPPCSSPRRSRALAVRRSSLSVGNARKMAERILKMRAKCDNVWAVITLNGTYLEQVRKLRLVEVF